MNLILLFPKDFDAPKKVTLNGRRLEHVQKILRAKKGDHLCVGVVNGKIGTGEITRLDSKSLEMSVDFSQNPPAPLPLTLICALPRPQVIKRILASSASLGIKKIIFLNFNRVEKSLWQSSSLKTAAIEEELVLGLEQAKDTTMPEVLLRPRFKPFVEDELPAIIKGTQALVAHPGASSPCPAKGKKPVTLVIGPEGGFVPYEVEKLEALGFKAFHLGPRILRTETVVPFILGRLFNQ